MKKFIYPLLFAVIVFISCSSMSGKTDSENRIFFDDEYNSLNENDYANLVIKKDFFSHQYIEDDDSVYEKSIKEELQRNLRPLNFGEYKFTGTAIYDGCSWKICLIHRHGLKSFPKNYIQSACCDNIEMRESTRTDCSHVFKTADDNKLYYHINENAFTKANCIIRPDGSVAAKIKHNTFIFDESLTEEEKNDVVKCIALYKCLSYYE